MEISKKKILMVMPALPFPYRGAEQMDRAYGIKQLVRLGYDVRVIAKLNEWQNDEVIKNASKDFGVKIIGVPYKYSNKKLSKKDKILKFIKKLSNPLYLDGAAFEYSEINIQSSVKNEVLSWKPDIVWFEYSYLWPLYHIPQSQKIPIITRSINFEPNHFIEEDGKSIINLIKYIPKLVGEYLIAKKSDVVFSITPKEKQIYLKLGCKKVGNLPLRALPSYLGTSHEVLDRRPLKVFFMGSTYNVAHNKRALEEVIARIAPKIFASHPNDFKFYIMGNKFPSEYNKYLINNVESVGYVEDIDAFMKDMDIALIPSLFGAGMQQKIFESLSRGFPTVTSQRGMGGYPFEDNVHVLFADNADEFSDRLVKLLDSDLRKKLSMNATNLCKQEFSEEVLDRKVRDVVDSFQTVL